MVQEFWDEGVIRGLHSVGEETEAFLLRAFGVQGSVAKIGATLFAEIAAGLFCCAEEASCTNARSYINPDGVLGPGYSDGTKRRQGTTIESKTVSQKSTPLLIQNSNT